MMRERERGAGIQRGQFFLPRETYLAIVINLLVSSSIINIHHFYKPFPTGNQWPAIYISSSFSFPAYKIITSPLLLLFSHLLYQIYTSTICDSSLIIRPLFLHHLCLHELQQGRITVIALTGNITSKRKRKQEKCIQQIIGGGRWRFTMEQNQQPTMRRVATWSGTRPPCNPSIII